LAGRPEGSFSGLGGNLSGAELWGTVVTRVATVFFFLQPRLGKRVDSGAMKPTTLLSCLLALALTSAVSAEEPGRPPEGARPPERREDGDRDKPRERGPAPEVRRGEPARDGEAARPMPGRPPEGMAPRDGDKKPEARRDEGRSKGPKGEGHHGDKGRAEGPKHPPAGPEGMKGAHEGPGHPGGAPVNHVLEAIKHLHAAGMHEVASLLEAKVKAPGHPGRPGRPFMGMRDPHMMKPPFAHSGRPGTGPEGREMQRGPRPGGDKKPEGRPEGGPQRG